MENNYIILSLQNLVELNFKDFNYNINDYYFEIENEYILLIVNSNEYYNI